MINICGVCGNEKRYDEYHRKKRRCDLFNTKHALKNYHNNQDKILEKKKTYYHNNKEFFSEQIKERKNKKTDLENQINTFTEMIKSTISVS